MNNFLPDKLTIGITGGIGAGKSVVSRILRCNGFDVYDCDTKAKNIMISDPKVKNSLVMALGEEVYEPDGELNKKYLAKLMFSDDEIRNYVNSVVHSAVKQDIFVAREENKGWFFIESAILATSGIENICDSIWIVESSEETKLRRVMERDNLSESQIKARMQIQIKELSVTKNRRVEILKNDFGNPLLSKVLKLTDKYINHQIYTISC